jgi:hypothetical protein
MTLLLRTRLYAGAAVLATVATTALVVWLSFHVHLPWWWSPVQGGMDALAMLGPLSVFSLWYSRSHRRRARGGV